MADYATTEQVAAFAHEFEALSEVEAADTLITAASRLFDRLTGVADNFYAAADVDAPITYTERTFYGNGTGYLLIDPYVALNPVDPVVIDPENAYDIPDYQERDGMLVLYGTFANRFTGWNDGVKVTVSANWGFPAIPPDVTMATVHLAIHLWRTADPAFAQISNADNTVSVRTVPRVAEVIIEAYKAKYMQGFAFA